MDTPLNCSLELDRYVMRFSDPKLDSYSEMKILQELISGGDILLLKTLIGKLVTASSTEKRTPVFRKLALKFGYCSSAGNSNKEARSVVDCKESENLSPFEVSEKRGSHAYKMSHRNSVIENKHATSVMQRTPEHVDVASHSHHNSVEVESCQSNRSHDQSSVQNDTRSDYDSLEYFQESLISSDSKQLQSRKVPVVIKSDLKQTLPIEDLDTYKGCSGVEKQLHLGKLPTIHKDKFYTCEVCKKVFNKQASVVMHKRSAHRLVKDFSKLFVKRKRTGGKYIKCKDCEKIYNTKEHLDRHTSRAHNAKSTIPCPEKCGKMLTSKGAIKRHLWSHRPQSEWPVGCPFCSKRVLDRHDLSRHVGTMHKEEKLPEAGSDEWWLLVYWDKPENAPKNKVSVGIVSKRTGKKHVKCKKRGRKFDNKGHLDHHTSRAHNIKSTIPCPENCGKMLSSKWNIKRHLWSHRPQSEWPVGCPFCSKRFVDRYELSRHLLGTKHKEEKLPEAGSDEWWQLVYWDKPEDAPKNKVSVESLPTKRRELKSQNGAMKANLVVRKLNGTEFNEEGFVNRPTSFHQEVEIETESFSGGYKNSCNVCNITLPETQTVAEHILKTHVTNADADGLCHVCGIEAQEDFVAHFTSHMISKSVFESVEVKDEEEHCDSKVNKRWFLNPFYAGNVD